MKSYQWILFDADETLFSFDAYAGLKRMFTQFGIDFSLQDYDEYEATNQPLWVDYQNGTITAKELQQRRFDRWARELQCNPEDLNGAFMRAMAEICAPLDGAVSLLNALKGKTKMGIITNGFVELQQTRLEHTGLKDYFDLLVISEQVGFAKPQLGIFEHALLHMGNPPREQVLMVGDNPASDILGGINAGLHTCWINAKNQAAPEGITPHYQVTSLAELELILQY